jgi:hypothetical protein
MFGKRDLVEWFYHGRRGKWVGLAGDMKIFGKCLGVDGFSMVVSQQNARSGERGGNVGAIA